MKTSASRPSARSVPSGRTKPKPAAARRKVPVKWFVDASVRSSGLRTAFSFLVGSFAIGFLGRGQVVDRR